MRTLSKKSKSKWKALSAVSAVLGLFLFTAVIVYADSVPSVTTVVQNDVTNAAITSAPVGLVVHDFVTVASTTDSSASSTPTGTVNFTMFPNTTCSGDTSSSNLNVPLVNGMAQSASTTVPSTGLSFLATYNGQAGVYSATGSPCESLTIVAATSTATSTASTTMISTALSTSTIMASSTAYDTATLSGNTANAGGNVAYILYNDTACSVPVVGAGVFPVTNGIVPTSTTIFFPAPGTLYWQATYSGDTNNLAATSTCQNEVLTVLPLATSTPTSTPTTTPPTTSGHGSISGTIYNDLNRSGVKDAGEPLLSGWTINLYSGSQWSGPTDQASLMTTVSDANGAYSFTNLADGTYSIEEINQPSLNQFTSDYSPVVITNGSVITGEDFGNVAGDPGVNVHKHNKHGQGGNQGNFGHRNDNDNASSTTATSTDDVGNTNNHGNHFGWTRGAGNPHGNRGR